MKSDAPGIYKIFSDPDVARYWSSPQMKDMAEAETFIEQANSGFEDGSLLEWGIFEISNNKLVGTCAYASWSRKHRRAEIGFALRRDCWNKGLMSEFLPKFIAFGFEELDLHRIEADVDPRNYSSIRLLEKAGCKREGVLRERYHTNGEVQNAVIYGLLKSEFSSKKGR